MDYCLSLPFDQYQRYKLVSDIINKFRSGEKKFKILEVGAGFEENLKKFLPSDDIYYLDKEYPSEYSHKENFISGDILPMKFTEKYDFVVTIDVYEHISRINREKFIEIIIPLSEIATIIAAPFDQDEVRKCEFFANEVYKNSHGSDYIWLKEHIENGLPSLPETLKLINNYHKKPVIIPNGYLLRWFEMISAFLLTVGKPEFQPMMTTLNELYNQNFYKCDNRNPAYRQIIIIPKYDREIDFSDLTAGQINPEEFQNKNLLLESFIEKIKRSYIVSDNTHKLDIQTLNQQNLERSTQILALEQANATKDSQLDHMSVQIQTLVHTSAAKDAQLDQMSDQIQALVHTSAAKDAQLDQMSDQIQALVHTSAAKDAQLDQMSDQIQALVQTSAAKNAQLDQMSDQILLMKETVARQKEDLETARNQLDIANQTTNAMESEIFLLNSNINKLQVENDSIKSSISYRFFAKFQKKIIEPLFPPATKRRELYDVGLKGGRIVVSQGFSKALLEYKRYRAFQKHKVNNRRILPDRTAPEVKTEETPDNSNNQTIIHLHNQNKQEFSEYVLPARDAISLTKDDIKCIAFYLPQFHPIPENDQWWGKGFTEWTNVTKALPQFLDHYQPHLPDELGFYDLRLPEIQKRQIELARQYGIYGFCFHYYWFDGKRLLHKPLDQFLENKEFDFPFCICWANENWTRRWDGMENEILISQTHSPENDIRFIRDIEHILADPRYIRVNGKPLILVYRATLLPEAKETTQRWREYCKAAGIGDLYLVAALVFGCENPEEHGFDAAVEFPPHTMSKCNIITEEMKILNPHFSGQVYDYEDFVITKKYCKEVPYRRFRTVSPGWDNTARRPNDASIFYGANPALYKEWLFDVAKLTKETHPPEEQIVFINAWNEWAEGTHLEPDRKFGYGYLQATADVIREIRDPAGSQKKKIILVSHDAHFHGAQLLALHLVKEFKERFHYEVYTILKSGGILEDEFGNYSQVINFERDYPDYDAKNKIISELFHTGACIAIANTVVTGEIVELLVKNHIKTLSLIHELPGIIKQMNQETNVQKIIHYADKIVFPSDFVKKKILGENEIHDPKYLVAPQGLYVKNTYKADKTGARKKLREKFSLPHDAKIIICVGYADYRKGADIFVNVAQKVLQNYKNSFFIWVGHADNTLFPEIQKTIRCEQLSDNVLFVGKQEDISLFYAGADVFLLTSREDPFPSVVLEALDVEVPVIGFEGAGGFSDILHTTGGLLVPYLDSDIMAEKVKFLLTNEGFCADMGRKGRELIERNYNFIDYGYHLLDLLDHHFRKVSVIVPNYNYEHYLKNRTVSILNQDYPLYEMIFLDDCSTDNSITFIENFAMKNLPGTTVVKNNKNSGSVFRQWEKGITRARGDYIWIAEADDLSEKSFLREVVAGFEDDEVVLSYCQSKQMDDNNVLIASDYCQYTNEIDENKWRYNYIRKGIDEICDTLAVKNTIPNISAAVLKKVDISEILEEITSYKVAGDWFFYVWILQKGKISFIARSLNIHRRHSQGVTISENARNHFDEIVRMQEYILQNFTISDGTRMKVLDYRKYVKKYLLGE
jgi:glycosyltransferase involved in cell wall biosynthesis